MLFEYRGVDFDINEKYISKAQAIEMLDPILDLASDISIAEVVIEDGEYGQIFIEGDSEEEFAQSTLDFYDKLPIDASLTDEDYGELDAINIYMEA